VGTPLSLCDCNGWAQWIQAYHALRHPILDRQSGDELATESARSFSGCSGLRMAGTSRRGEINWRPTPSSAGHPRVRALTGVGKPSYPGPDTYKYCVVFETKKNGVSIALVECFTAHLDEQRLLDSET
jgi:hypothetical protein